MRPEGFFSREVNGDDLTLNGGRRRIIYTAFIFSIIIRIDELHSAWFICSWGTCRQSCDYPADPSQWLRITM